MSEKSYKHVKHGASIEVNARNVGENDINQGDPVCVIGADHDGTWLIEASSPLPSPEELKPCRMCGGSPVMADKYGGFLMECAGCGIEACLSESEDDARESWNLWIGHEGYNMPTPTEIKPCPFCGGEASLRSVFLDYFVQCDSEKCGAQGPEFDAVGEVETDKPGAQAAARAAWNARPGDHGPTAAELAGEPNPLEAIDIGVSIGGEFNGYVSCSIGHEIDDPDAGIRGGSWLEPDQELVLEDELTAAIAARDAAREEALAWEDLAKKSTANLEAAHKEIWRLSAVSAADDGGGAPSAASLVAAVSPPKLGERR